MFTIFAPRVIVLQWCFARTFLERTKAALTEKNVQGFKLGLPQNLTDVSREKAAAARRKQAKEHIPNIRAIGLSTSPILGSTRVFQQEFACRLFGKNY